MLHVSQLLPREFFDETLASENDHHYCRKRNTYALWCLLQSKVLHSNSTAQRYEIKCTVCGVRAVELLVRVYYCNIIL